MKKNPAKLVKSKLDSIIKHTLLYRDMFTVDPGVNFTRNRKLGLKNLVEFIIKLGSSSLQSELIKYFKLSDSLMSASAFCKQRDKLKYSFFQHLFRLFSSSFEEHMKTKFGYRLIAVDGSTFVCPRNPEDEQTFIKTRDSKGYNQVHLNACYDLVNGIYTAASVAVSSKAHERKEFIQLLEQYNHPEKCLFIADRGYESFNVLAHLIEKKAHFLIRVRDIDSNMIMRGLHLEDEKSEFDKDIVKYIAKSKKSIRSLEMDDNASIYYCYEHPSVDFITEANPYYEMHFRVVRFKLDNGSYEAVITNLPREEATPAQLKRFYNMRWGIETSFRTLKYTLGGYIFHSKKMNAVMQELYGKLVLYNFCCFIIALTDFKDETRSKYQKKIKMATAIEICATYLNEGSQVRVEEILSRFLTPIRKNRSSPRGRIREQPAKAFNYRPC